MDAFDDEIARARRGAVRLALLVGTACGSGCFAFGKPLGDCLLDGLSVAVGGLIAWTTYHLISGRSDTILLASLNILPIWRWHADPWLPVLVVTCLAMLGVGVVMGLVNRPQAQREPEPDFTWWDAEVDLGSPAFVHSSSISEDWSPSPRARQSATYASVAAGILCLVLSSWNWQPMGEAVMIAVGVALAGFASWWVYSVQSRRDGSLFWAMIPSLPSLLFPAGLGDGWFLSLATSASVGVVAAFLAGTCLRSGSRSPDRTVIPFHDPEFDGPG